MNLKIQLGSKNIDGVWMTICETNERYVNDILDALYIRYKSRDFRVVDNNSNEVKTFI